MSRPFAAFDIDGTVIRWQLFHAIMTQLALQGSIPAEVETRIATSRSVWQKRENKDSFHTYERNLVDEYVNAIAGLSVSELDRAVDIVFEQYKNLVYTYTRDLIYELKEKGYLLFAVSGSQQQIVDRFVEYYGFDDAIGTVQNIEGDRFLATMETPVGDKAAALRQLVEKHGATYEGSLAIGDSRSDAKMLEIVEQPIAFNPASDLLEIAKAAGWPLVIERKNVMYRLEQRDGQYVLA